MSRSSDYRPEYCAIASKVLADGESLAAVCAELEISRPTLYTWRDSYPDFAEALSIGMQKAQRDWEALGRDGIAGNLDKFSASPWIFTMKNRFREDYKEEKAAPTTSDTLVEKMLDKLIT